MTYLLLKRNPRPELALPGFWQGISGALEPDESHEAAAIREVAEETRLSIDGVSDSVFCHCYPIKDEWRAAYGDGPKEVEERVFYALVDNDVLPVLSAEHQEWGWFGKEQAIALLTFGRTRDCLLAVDQAISA